MAELSIRIDFGPSNRLGPGKIKLLESIRDHGSISAAGRAMKMSYRRAWMLINELNDGFEEPVVDARAGGSHGGGARLTAFGATLIDQYRSLEAKASAAAAPHLELMAPPRRSRPMRAAAT